MDDRRPPNPYRPDPPLFEPLPLDDPEHPMECSLALGQHALVLAHPALEIACPALGLAHPRDRLADTAQLADQPDLTEHQQVFWHDLPGVAAVDRDGDRQIDGGLGDAHPACDADKNIVVRQR